MYLFSFSRYAGHDRVFWVADAGMTAGDLLKYQDDYLLVLGDNIAWKEQYTYKRGGDRQKIEVLVPGLLSETSLQQLHHFVYQWYTTYKKSLPLRTGVVEELIKRKPSKKSRTQKKNNIKKLHITEGLLVTSDEPVSSQQLVVFPDIWRLFTMSPKPLLQEDSGVLVLHSRMTKKQQAEAFWSIKGGSVHTVLSTPSQIFWDRAELGHIVLVDQHTWYYKNHQDPRYAVQEVLKKLAEMTNVSLVKTGYIL